MRTKLSNLIKLVVFFLMIATTVFSQDITNTIAPSGKFIVRDASNNFLTLDQSTGQMNILKTFRLENTTSSTTGVIFKGADWFIHNYGSNNTFMGNNSGNFTLTTANSNTGIGGSSLFSLTTGYWNTAVGHNSLASNTSGVNNTTVGYNSLASNTTGSYNTAVGLYSLNSNTTGFYNTALGLLSLSFNTSGHNNTAVGEGSLEYNTTGLNNTALGYSSGSTIIAGTNLTCIGYDAEPTTGYAVNQITLGNNVVSVLRCNTQTITSLSDARDKKNINDLNLGIDFLMKIKPRLFNWDKREWYEDNISDGSKMKEEPTAGFIAQELDEAQTTGNAEWLNLVLKDNPEKWEATAGNLLPIVVRAIQELKIKNEQLKIEKDEEIAVLQNKNQNLEERLTKFEEMQTVLVKKIERIESSEQLIKVQIVNSENNNQ